MIFQGDSLELLKKAKDFEYDLIFSDPPYFLGSEWVIDSSGNYVFKKHADFTNKWSVENMNGYYWNEWFEHAFRIIKHGSPVILFSMDRQQDVLTYYARKNGFEVKQSLYWIYAQNFPKSVNVSKQLDKRESDLSKKYDGYHYSQAPLKQNCEIILVFRKPCKVSVLDDIIAYENNDATIYPAIVNIDKTRIELLNEKKSNEDDGRYTSQILIDKNVEEEMSKQGEKTCSNVEGSKVTNKNTNIFNGKVATIKECKEDVPQSFTKVYTKINSYDDIDEPYFYCKKVSREERNLGCDNLEKKKIFNVESTTNNISEEDNKRPYNEFGQSTGLSRWGNESANNHVSLKPIELCYWILKLFLPPNKNVKLLNPFSGAGSELVAAELHTIQYDGFEIDADYMKICVERLKKAQCEPQSFFNFFGNKKHVVVDTNKYKSTLAKELE